MLPSQSHKNNNSNNPTVMATYPQMSYSPSQQWQYPPSSGPAGSGTSSASNQQAAGSYTSGSRLGYPLMSNTGTSSGNIYSQPRFDAFNGANPNIDLSPSVTSPTNINYYRYPRSPVETFYSTGTTAGYPNIGPNTTSPTDETFTATSASTTMPTSMHQTTTPRGRSGSTTVYEFVSLAGSQQQKRPRRKYEEIERIYNCNYPGCTKAYGTLNHLNAHVSMQKHGMKRTPEEFKETRRLWKLRKTQQQQQQQSRQQPQQTQAQHQHQHSSQDTQMSQQKPKSSYPDDPSQPSQISSGSLTDSGLAPSPNATTSSPPSNSRQNSAGDLSSSGLRMPLYGDISLGYSQPQTQFDSNSPPYYDNNA